MRIIAGSARGRTLVAPKGQQTRPTQDYVRESLFNIIQRDVPDASVLDLFAGTGALALEALSRGAQKAVLADSSRQAIDCIRRNVETVGTVDRATVIPGDWNAVLQKLAEQGELFDLVFLDPPYRLTQYAEITGQLQSRNLLREGALLVIEHRKDYSFALSPAFVPRDHRTYGDTEIHMVTFNTGGSTDGE